MTKNSPTIAKILQTLRNEDITVEQKNILTYIQTEIGMKMLSTIDEIQYAELCKLLIALISAPDQNETNDDIIKNSEEAMITLYSALKNFDKHHVNLFEIMLHIDRNKRLKMLEVFNSIEIHILIKISRDSMIVNFLNDSFQMAKPSLMEWLANNTCTDNIQPLNEAQTQCLSVEQINEEQLILNTLTMLHRLYEHATSNSSDFNIEVIHPLLFKKVVPLAYMGYRRQRRLALKLLNQALNTNFISHIKTKYSNLWSQYKNTLQDIYCTRMSLLVKSAESDWSDQWCFSIKMLGINLHRGAELINNLLNVEEKAFKSTNMTTRKEAFDSWKCLIDNFAMDTAELTTSRRLKLLCIPLNAKNSKIEAVAIAKLETWWHLIIKLYSIMDKSLNQVIGQFLNFCFGPLNDTSLLSIKSDTIASPGKRFPNTKILAVDVLLQLLIQKPIDRIGIPRFIEERLPNAVSNSVFQANYKNLFHSVCEAVLVVNELSENELNNHVKINEMLWSNLMMYIQQSPTQQKTTMYREFLFIINELVSHITDKPLIIDQLLDIIIGHLVQVTQYLMYRDPALMDLLLKFLSPPILKCINKKHSNNFVYLISHAIKPEKVDVYHPSTLTFIKSALTNMISVMKHQPNSYVFDLWGALAEIMIKYMKENQQINEGTAAYHSFETVQLLIILPINHFFGINIESILKMCKIWGELYKQFVLNADVIETVQPNEILHTVSTTMESCFMKDNRCYNVIAYCLEAVMSTIKYEALVSERRIPPLINLLRNITFAALTRVNEFAVEYSLKATSSMLITVYGLNQTCALMYLEALKPTIELMLKIECMPSVEKNIINTWKVVVIIIRSLVKLLTYDFVSSYQQTILLALHHNNYEIVNQALSLIDIRNDSNEDAKISFEEFGEIAKKIRDMRTNSEQKNNKVVKTHGQMSGGSFDHKISSPEELVAARIVTETKNMGISPLTPYESEYVVSKNEVKIDINYLPAHQMKSLKRHEGDIETVYNVFSQSASHNIQDLKNWLENNTVVANEERNVDENTYNDVAMNHETNKEKNATSAVAIQNNNEKRMSSTPLSKLHKGKTNIITGINLGYNIELNNHTSSGTNAVTLDEKLLRNRQVDGHAGDSRVPHVIRKESNFVLHEDFSANNDNISSIINCSLQSKDTESCEGGQAKNINRIGSRSDDIESDSLELLHSMRHARTRGRTAKMNEKSLRHTNFANNCNRQSERKLKRKTTSTSEPDGLSRTKRRRCTTTVPSSSDTACDIEYNKSMRSENYSVSSLDDDIPKRTKKEMSRLQINMVFNSRMSSKLRSKSADDYVYSSNKRRQRSKNNSNKAEQESHETNSKTKKHNINIVEPNKSNMMDDRKIFEDTSRGTAALALNENSISVAKKQFNNVSNNHETSTVDDSTKYSSWINNNSHADHIDVEEVVENSQNTNSFIRSPHRKHHEERLDAIASLTEMDPKKILSHDASDDKFKTTDLTVCEVVYIPKSTQEKSANELITADSSFSSPTSIKRPLKTKMLMPKGRAAHMLGLITKFALSETNESSDENKYSKEIGNKIKSSKELDCDESSKKNERASILRDPDHVNSSTGSRQKKIFNNMKSKNCTSAPSSKIFNKLKNDDGKISPELKKISSKNSMQISDKDQNMHANTSYQKNELSILEWSNGNSPSSTVLSNDSILKRPRQIASDIAIDMVPNKKKRVSFADPPVSRTIGYEVIRGSLIGNEFGLSRILPERKNTPIKVKHTRFRTIRFDIDKLNQSPNKMINKSIFKNIIEIEHKKKKLLSGMENNSDIEHCKSCDEQNLKIVDFHNNKTNNILTEKMLTDELTIISTLDLDHAKSLNDTEIIDKPNSVHVNTDSLATQQVIHLKVPHSTHVDILHHSQMNCDNTKSKIRKTKQLDRTRANGPEESSKFEITNGTTIARILNDSNHSSKSNYLQDTVDIQNISSYLNSTVNFVDAVHIHNIGSNFNSTVNSNESCYDKIIRTSTEIDAINQYNTLPATDSMFFSGTVSQNSLTTQQSLALSQPYMRDVTNSIYPSLMDCNDPIDAIINNLVNPLWAKNLSKYLALRSINTIGDLAQLSERDLARFPIKGSPKINYIKQVLNDFSLSRLSLWKYETINEKVITTNKAVCSRSHALKKYSEILDGTFKLNNKNYKDVENNITTIIGVTSLSSVNQSLYNVDGTKGNIEIVEKILEKNLKIIKSNNCNSLDIPISLSFTNCDRINQTEKIKLSVPAEIGTLRKAIELIDHDTSPSSSKFKETQTNIEFLYKIDPILLLQYALKRNTFENIIAQFKMRMKDESGHNDFTRENSKIFGFQLTADMVFENICRDYGLKKVLERLPNIFDTNGQFFTKVLNTYRMNIVVRDYINTLDSNQVKKVIYSKYSLSELCEMLSTVLINKKRDSINAQITDVSSLNAMSKRKSIDSTIGHTVINNELIPSSTDLEMALQNDNCDTIKHKIKAQVPNTENNVDENIFFNTILSYINESKLSKDKLLDIYRAVCNKLNPGQILDVHSEIMKEKLRSFDKNELQ